MKNNSYFSFPHKISILFLACLVVLILTSSCKSKKTPKDLIQPKQMALIMADVHILESTIASRTPQEDYDLRKGTTTYYHDVFQKHGVSDTLFEKSLSWYTLHSDQFKKVYDLVEKELSKEQ